MILKHRKNNVFLQHLAENRIGNEGAEAISDMLQKNDMIYSLDLSGNSIEDYGAEKLCRVLLVNRFLSNLNTIKSLKKTLINSQASSFDPLVEDFD